MITLAFLNGIYFCIHNNLIQILLRFFRNTLGAFFSVIWAFFMRIWRAYYNREGGSHRTRYRFPTLNVGNLSTGGTGKTPHIEYLVNLLKDDCRLAILSRGYGRETKGFLFADSQSNSRTIGDEPMQFHTKFPYIPVAVDKNRIRGIRHIRKSLPETSIILLDDAYQYLDIRAGLNILLTEYNRLYTDDHVLPWGNLREPASAASEADAIIVTKCPSVLSPIHEHTILKKLNARPDQPVFFSYMNFLPIEPITPVAKMQNPGIKSVVLMTAIANPQPLISYLKANYKEFQMLTFRDHHPFTKEDLQKARQLLNRSLSPYRAIIVTEKDAMRLINDDLAEIRDSLPIYTLPIKVEFHSKYREPFHQFISDHVKKYS